MQRLDSSWSEFGATLSARLTNVSKHLSYRKEAS
jgi:hypothetical protein